MCLGQEKCVRVREHPCGWRVSSLLSQARLLPWAAASRVQEQRLPVTRQILKSTKVTFKPRGNFQSDLMLRSLHLFRGRVKLLSLALVLLKAQCHAN